MLANGLPGSSDHVTIGEPWMRAARTRGYGGADTAGDEGKGGSSMSDLIDRRGTSGARRGVFGKGLCELRQRHGLGVQQMAVILSRGGYEIMPVLYSSLEEGTALPERAAQFIDVLGRVLSLSIADTRDLSERLAYDILFARLGQHADTVLAPKATWLA